MKKVLIFSVAVLLAIAFGCTNNDKEVIGSGKVIDIETDTQPFTEIILKSGHANLTIKQAPAEYIKISGEDNIINLFSTKVENGVLTIEELDHYFIRNTKPIEFYVTMTTLKSVSLSGSSDLKGQGTLKIDKLKISLAGSGNIDLDLIGKALVLDISGSGDANFKGSINTQDVTINGSGSYKAENLVTKDSSIKINGSGQAMVNAQDNLNVEIYGAGRREIQRLPNIAPIYFRCRDNQTD